MGIVGMITIEEAGTAMKTGMTHEMMGHGAPEMFTLGIIISMMVEFPYPTPQDPN